MSKKSTESDSTKSDRKSFTVEREERDRQRSNQSVMADEFDDFFGDNNTSSEQNKTEEKDDKGTFYEKSNDLKKTFLVSFVFALQF